ncbi:MAG: PSD1 and planctomycete cytochrome C domain-containing protein [Planctomycetota bacterium]|nr:PSD1 and planctomycete cytochrome C domain-containing protein [Planctomycetota bacterium]
MASSTLPAQESQPTLNAEQVKFYIDQVAPILVNNCFGCHGPGSSVKGDLYLGNRQDILKGGETGPAVDLENPMDSLIVQAMLYQDMEMPPKGKLPQSQIDIVLKWITAGMRIPPDRETERPVAPKSKYNTEINDETKSLWQHQPVPPSTPPSVKNKKWPANGIDHYILSRLEKAKINPNGPAERAHLIRRAYYDLTGLPPAVEVVDEFVQDTDPAAYENLIDRLLKSPQYGEKWGRHWLDLVRYAETNSYERDGTKPFAWRYRDYVIRSFNEDKPYDLFIKEQLAGDEFETLTADSITATGYYRLGIWDDEPVSQKQALYDDLDDILLTTSQVFLGLTINCARCHDHKLDPISQKDYYRFLAFFSGFRRYGVRGHDTVESASIGPIAVNADQAMQSQMRQQLDKELGELDRTINNVNNRLQGLMSAPEKEDFKAIGVRVDLARKYIGKGLSKQLVEKYAMSVQRRTTILNERPAELAKTLVIKEIGPQPRETFVLVRGNANVESEKVQPGFPSVLSPPDPDIHPSVHGKSSGRRTALAQWITSKQNPLTARVMANRLWQHHFGNGIIATSNNFGAGGLAPSHPELLDYLANELMDGDWKLKRMHKLIMLSATYQMSSQTSKIGEAKDPTNQWMWRFNPRRLSSEELRDSILAANQSLNLEMGGPSFYPIIAPEVLHGQSRPGAGWGSSSEEQRARRAVYIFVKRSLVLPLMADFDFADVDSSCPVRFTTTQPTQSLNLLNSDFTNRQAAIFAEFLGKQSPDNLAGQVRYALQQVTQRRATDEEVARGVELIDQLIQMGVTEADALRYFCLVSYNLNEFLYVD